MKTELEIVYSLLNVARGGEHNNDENLTERLIRSFIRTYRPESLRKHYKDGVEVNDEVFQKKTLSLTLNGANEFVCQIPKIIRFDKNYGMYLEINGIEIPIVSSEAYSLNKKSTYNKVFVQSKTEYDKLIIYGGVYPNKLDASIDASVVISTIRNLVYEQQLANIQNSTNNPVIINADLKAVFFDPSDADNYNWETSMSPFPASRLPELEQQIMVKEFGMEAKSKSDEVQNARFDKVNYHENQQIRE